MPARPIWAVGLAASSAPRRRLLGPGGVTPVVAYYARGHCEVFDQHDDDRVIEDLIRQGSFDIVLLPDNRGLLHGRSDLLRHAAGLGYGPIDDRQLADGLRNMVVLVRSLKWVPSAGRD